MEFWITGKLHTVRLSTETPSAQMSMPLRPMATVRAGDAGVLVAGGGYCTPVIREVVPSTTTELRFIPRRWMYGVWISTPPYQPRGGRRRTRGVLVVGLLVVVAGCDEDPVPRLGCVHGRSWMVVILTGDAVEAFRRSRTRAPDGRADGSHPDDRLVRGRAGRASP